MYIGIYMPKKGYAEANIKYEIYDLVRRLRYTKIQMPINRFIESAILEKLIRDKIITSEELQKFFQSTVSDQNDFVYLYSDSQNDQQTVE